MRFSNSTLLIRPAPLILTPLAILLVTMAQLDALGLGPCAPGIDTFHDHAGASPADECASGCAMLPGEEQR
jgi:hypothetical protein